MGSVVPFSRITAILFKMVLKVWAYSGLVLVFCFLLYYMYGGLFAILLLFFAVTGKSILGNDNVNNPSSSRYPVSSSR